MTTGTENPSMLDDPHVQAAMRAHALERHHVAAVAVLADGVVIVTQGGAKLRWRRGDPAIALSAGQRGETVVCAAGHVRNVDLPHCRSCLSRQAKGDAKARAALTKSFRRYPPR